jgi:hypothetical protein
MGQQLAVVVTGSTGKQGGAVAWGLLEWTPTDSSNCATPAANWCCDLERQKHRRAVGTPRQQGVKKYDDHLCNRRQHTPESVL